MRIAGAAAISPFAPSSGRLPVAEGSPVSEEKGLVKGSPRREASDEQAAVPPPIIPIRAKRDSVLKPRTFPRTRIDAPA
ncbi:hypothetical protein GCM10025880_18460 [Methylorubrum aminovorans]|nr:hypothetical protein GCM10025880_18460 [Methylorubrum aminovorans]